MAAPIGASEQPDDQGTSPPLKETNETTLDDAAEVPPETSHPESPLKVPQESEKVTQAEGEKACPSYESEDSSEEESEAEGEEEAQGDSSEGTESDTKSNEENDIEVVDLIGDEEDDDEENNEGDGVPTNEQMEVEMDVTPLRMELPETSHSQTTEEELALLKRNDPIGYMKAKLAQRDTPLARAGAGSTNNPFPSDSRAILLNRVRRTILDVDLFEVLKKDSTACDTIKELLPQFNLATCSLEVSTILFDLQTL